MLHTNHSWDRSGTETQSNFVTVIDDRQATANQRYRIYTGEPVGGSP